MCAHARRSESLGLGAAMPRAATSMPLLLCLLTSCIGPRVDPGPPCPDGVHEGSLTVENDEYVVSGGAFGGTYSYGTVGAAGMEDCREIVGSLTFRDGVSTFSDFDGLELIRGSLSILGFGYPTAELGGRDDEPVVDGFGALRHVGGSVIGPTFTNLTSLETVGGSFLGGASSLHLLREVGGDFEGPGWPSGYGHLESLERIGGNFRTGVGTFDELVSLVSVGGSVEVGFANAVNFSPPLLAEVGGDLTIVQNRGVSQVSVPRLQRIGGRLAFMRNAGTAPGLSELARQAFAHVEIVDHAVICANGDGDYCPFHPECLDHFDESYCCDPSMDMEECLASKPWGD